MREGLNEGMKKYPLIFLNSKFYHSKLKKWQLPAMYTTQDY